MTRRLSIVVLSLLVLLAAASFLIWRWAEGRLADGFAQWQRSAAAQGWTVKTGGAARGGWPLAADLTLSDFSVDGGRLQVPGGAAYTAQRLTLHLDLLSPTSFLVQGAGQQSVRVGPSRPLPFTASRFNVTVPISTSGPPVSAALDASGLTFAAPAEGLSVGLLQGRADWPPAGPGAPHRLGLRLSAEAITLPPPPPPLGAHIASATIEGTVSGTMPPDARSPAAAVKGWRDSGGAIALDHIAIGWGPLGMTGTMTLKLDGDLQPDAKAALRLVGLSETLTALAAAHAISPNAAQAAEAVVGLIARAPESGGQAGVDLPVTLHDRTLTVGMIPLATFGKLIWPDAP